MIIQVLSLSTPEAIKCNMTTEMIASVSWFLRKREKNEGGKTKRILNLKRQLPHDVSNSPLAIVNESGVDFYVCLMDAAKDLEIDDKLFQDDAS